MDSDEDGVVPESSHHMMDDDSKMNASMDHASYLKFKEREEIMKRLVSS